MTAKKKPAAKGPAEAKPVPTSTGGDLPKPSWPTGSSFSVTWEETPALTTKERVDLASLSLIDAARSAADRSVKAMSMRQQASLLSAAAAAYVAVNGGPS